MLVGAVGFRFGSHIAKQYSTNSNKNSKPKKLFMNFVLWVMKDCGVCRLSFRSLITFVTPPLPRQKAGFLLAELRRQLSQAYWSILARSILTPDQIQTIRLLDCLISNNRRRCFPQFGRLVGQGIRNADYCQSICIEREKLPSWNWRALKWPDPCSPGRKV